MGIIGWHIQFTPIGYELGPRTCRCHRYRKRWWSLAQMVRKLGLVCLGEPWGHLCKWTAFRHFDIFQSIHILGVGTDGQGWHQSYDNGAWGNFETIGGAFDTSTTLSANTWGSTSTSTTTTSSSTTIDVAGIGADRGCHHKHFSASSWSSWDNRGGSFVSDVQVLSVSST